MKARKIFPLWASLLTKIGKATHSIHAVLKALVVVMMATAVQADAKSQSIQISDEIAEIGFEAAKKIPSREDRIETLFDLAFALNRKGGTDDAERIFSYALTVIPSIFDYGVLACAVIKGADKAVKAGRDDFARTLLAKGSEALDDKLHAAGSHNLYSDVAFVADVALWRHWLGDEDGFNWTMDTARRLLEQGESAELKAQAYVKLGETLAKVGRTGEARKSFATGRVLAGGLDPGADSLENAPRLRALVYLLQMQHASGFTSDARKTLKYIRSLPEASGAVNNKTIALMTAALSKPPPPLAVPPEERLQRTCP